MGDVIVGGIVEFSFALHTKATLEGTVHVGFVKICMNIGSHVERFSLARDS